MGEWPGRNIIFPKIPLLVQVRHTFIHGNNIVNETTTNNIDKSMIQTFLFMVSIKPVTVEHSGKFDVRLSIKKPWLEIDRK
jgi:hypothetical protein